jgi:hypothetical protein
MSAAGFALLGAEARIIPGSDRCAAGRGGHKPFIFQTCANRPAATNLKVTGALARCSHPIAGEPPSFGAHMAEIVRFVPKSELERARLIREARAIYESIFPQADAVSERRDPKP